MSIQVRGLSKHFRLFKREAGLKGAVTSFFNRKYENFHALKDVSINIEDGEILGILGENGAGKTTLIKLLVGLLHPSSGDVNINGFIPWKRNNTFLKQISIVMGQKNQLWWDIPASESFLLNKKIYEIPEKQYKQTLNELVELLDVKEKLNTLSNAEFLIHPECSCTTPMIYDVANGSYNSSQVQILSTEGMMNHVKNSNSNEFVVATETGILYRMKQQNPSKKFIPASENAECEYMKMITLEKVYDSLLNEKTIVTVPKETADKARLAIERMLAIS